MTRPLALASRLTLLAALTVAPLGARQVVAPKPRAVDSPVYSMVATLPSTVEGQDLRAFAFDPVSNRLYAGSDRGLFWSDLSEKKPTMKGPLFKKDILRIEVAPDLGRLFFFTYDEFGYVNLRGTSDPVRLGPRDWATDLVYEPTQHEIYVGTRSPKVRVFDARSGERRADIDVPGFWGHDLEAIPGRVFLGVEGKSGLYVINAATHALAPWPVKGRIVTPVVIEADPSGKNLFVAYSQDIVAIDTATATVVGRVITSTPAAIAFDPGSHLLLATWDNVPPPNRVVAYRVDETGLSEVARFGNPARGLVGLEPTSRGFIQAGVHSLLVWAFTGPVASGHP